MPSFLEDLSLSLGLMVFSQGSQLSSISFSMTQKCLGGFLTLQSPAGIIMACPWVHCLLKNGNDLIRALFSSTNVFGVHLSSWLMQCEGNPNSEPLLAICLGGMVTEERPGAGAGGVQRCVMRIGGAIIIWQVPPKGPLNVSEADAVMTVNMIFHCLWHLLTHEVLFVYWRYHWIPRKYFLFHIFPFEKAVSGIDSVMQTTARSYSRGRWS